MPVLVGQVRRQGFGRGERRRPECDLEVVAVLAGDRRRAHVVHVSDLGRVFDQPKVDADEVESQDRRHVVDGRQRTRRVPTVVEHVLVAAVFHPGVQTFGSAGGTGYALYVPRCGQVVRSRW